MRIADWEFEIALTRRFAASGPDVTVGSTTNPVANLGKHHGPIRNPQSALKSPV
jgi:hypothetical protein